MNEEAADAYVMILELLSPGVGCWPSRMDDLRESVFVTRYLRSFEPVTTFNMPMLYGQKTSGQFYDGPVVE